MSSFRILGIILSLVGIAASVFPQWFGPLTGASEPTLDVFESIERRVRGGMLLGVGLGFAVITSLRPWATSVPMAIFYFVVGALTARILGLMLDGAIPKQWLLVAVEGVILTVVALWLWRYGQPVKS